MDIAFLGMPMWFAVIVMCVFDALWIALFIAVDPGLDVLLPPRDGEDPLETLAKADRALWSVIVAVMVLSVIMLIAAAIRIAA